MGSTIQLNITVPTAAAGFPQASAQYYPQGIQLHLSITMPPNLGVAPLAQTISGSPTPAPCIESNLIEREANLRRTLIQRRPSKAENYVVHSETVPSVVSLNPSPHRAGSEVTSSEGTLCSNGSHPSENSYHQVVNDGEKLAMDSHAEPPIPAIDAEPLQQPKGMPTDDGQQKRRPPRTPSGSPYRLRSVSPQSEYRSLRAERGRSRESKIIGDNRRSSPDSFRSIEDSSVRSRSPYPMQRQDRSDSRHSSRSSSTSLAISREDEEGNCTQEPPSPLILRVDTRGQESSPRATGHFSEPLSHRIGFYSNNRRTCPFFHKNPEDRHPNHRPHPGYTEAEFDQAVKIYARRDRMPNHLVKPNVEVNWGNQKRDPYQSPTYGSSSPVKRRFERPNLRTSFSTYDNFEPAAKRQKMRHQSYDARDQGLRQYEADPHDSYVHRGDYVNLSEYSPRAPARHHRYLSPDSRTQYQPDYFIPPTPRGIYERSQDVRTDW